MTNLLNRARHEIIALRRQNEILSAQVAVVQVFAAALGLKQVEQGECVDVAWELEREVERLTREEKDNAVSERR